MINPCRDGLGGSPNWVVSLSFRSANATLRTATHLNRTVTPQHICCVSNENASPSSYIDVKGQVLLPLSLSPEQPMPIVSQCGASVLHKDEDRNPVRTNTGLRRTPITGGVKNATMRYDLPPPAVAVRNLTERAQFAHLCTVMSKMHHRRSGYPFGTLVDFAVDGGGYPLLCLSPLAIHTRNLLEDPRVSLVVQMPGWTGLANARVTIFGEVYRMPPTMQELASEIFLEKHVRDRSERWLRGNFNFFRMNNISDIYFVGGFGTVQWVEPQEYSAAQPDDIVFSHAQETIEVLNARYGGTLQQRLSAWSTPADEASVISVDRLGMDMRVRKGGDNRVERIAFDQPVSSLEEALDSLHRMLVEPVQAPHDEH